MEISWLLKEGKNAEAYAEKSSLLSKLIGLNPLFSSDHIAYIINQRKEKDSYVIWLRYIALNAD